MLLRVEYAGCEAPLACSDDGLHSVPGLVTMPVSLHSTEHHHAEDFQTDSIPSRDGRWSDGQNGSAPSHNGRHSFVSGSRRISTSQGGDEEGARSQSCSPDKMPRFEHPISKRPDLALRDTEDYLSALRRDSKAGAITPGAPSPDPVRTPGSLDKALKRSSQLSQERTGNRRWSTNGKAWWSETIEPQSAEVPQPAGLDRTRGQRESPTGPRPSPRKQRIRSLLADAGRKGKPVNVVDSDSPFESDKFAVETPATREPVLTPDERRRYDQATRQQRYTPAEIEAYELYVDKARQAIDREYGVPSSATPSPPGSWQPSFFAAPNTPGARSISRSPLQFPSRNTPPSTPSPTSTHPLPTPPGQYPSPPATPPTPNTARLLARKPVASSPLQRPPRTPPAGPRTAPPRPPLHRSTPLPSLRPARPHQRPSLLGPSSRTSSDIRPAPSDTHEPAPNPSPSAFLTTAGKEAYRFVCHGPWRAEDLRDWLVMILLVALGLWIAVGVWRVLDGLRQLGAWLLWPVGLTWRLSRWIGGFVRGR